MSRHLCKGKTNMRMYGPAIGRCEEDEDGTFWVDNGEYASQVSYCPYCGAQAPTPAVIEEDEDDG